MERVEASQMGTLRPMEPRLMKESFEDYARVMRGRYARCMGRPARQKPLDGHCRSNGLERRHANRVLRGRRRRGSGGARRGAGSRYAGEIRAAPPFATAKLDFDSGGGFLGAHFIAHIEQKNHAHVCLLLGDDRFERHGLADGLSQAHCEWSLWNNLYAAQRRLLRKERQADGKVRRYHAKTWAGNNGGSSRQCRARTTRSR